eukprot:CAMPEP_0177432434 /NCGR_PEP_ID=MMETSP0368-20130122/76691_1 /TAXON_ID=447022 ORGANISM="Scrippsiella hangoei-like, Strain SHHI-4" /NCGR_SAMPLE_ID=MMETSP0368 /ASSEMBLY_ACC=CAM_ASM_000363 /LENGTH=533 /DNA_ID=CAMNT_0018903101 /DNA_START=28 /DNA_END=1631 /DNA_ORIENTATION=+
MFVSVVLLEVMWLVQGQMASLETELMADLEKCSGFDASGSLTLWGIEGEFDTEKISHSLESVDGAELATEKLREHKSRVQHRCLDTAMHVQQLFLAYQRHQIAYYDSSDLVVVQVMTFTGTSMNNLSKMSVILRNVEGKDMACGSLGAACKFVHGYCLHSYMTGIAGACAIMADIITFYVLVQHLRKSRSRGHETPQLRRCTIRILLMVPTYTTEAFVSLWEHVGAEAGEILKFTREIWEAVVIFSFLQYVLLCVGGPAAVSARQGAAPHGTVGHDLVHDPADQQLGDHSKPIHLQQLWPFKYCFPAWRSADQMQRWCVRVTLLYMFVTVTFSIIGFFTSLTGAEKLTSKVILIGGLVLMGAQSLAMTGMATFCHTFLGELKPMRPLAKFLTVKGVVFLSFWQSLIIKAAVYFGAMDAYVDQSGMWNSAEQLNGGMQNFLICVEMNLAAIGFVLFFQAKDYDTALENLNVVRVTVTENPKAGGMLHHASKIDVLGFMDVLKVAFHTQRRYTQTVPITVNEVGKKAPKMIINTE